MLPRPCALAIAAIAACSTPAVPPQTAPVVDAAVAEFGYTCPMHPGVHQPGPGSCPTCGMDLVPATSAAVVDAFVLPDTVPGLVVAIEERQAKVHDAVNAGKFADVRPVIGEVTQLAVGLATSGKALPPADSAELTLFATALTEQADALRTAADSGDAAATQRALEAFDAAIAKLARFKG